MDLSREQFRTRLRAVASDLATERPDLAARVWRAVALVEAGAVHEPAGSPTVRVRSQSRRGAYVVSPNAGCSCPDSAEGRAPQFGRVAGCKHLLAYWLQVRASLITAPPTGGRVVPFPRPTLDPDAPIPFELTPKALAALGSEGPSAA